MKKIIIFCVIWVWGNWALGQDFEPYRSAPLAMARFKKGNTYLKITYGQVEKTGKWVFGYQIPYRRLWRTGADEATELTLSDTVRLGENKIPPGTYSLFTIPDTAEWTLVINREVGMSGLFTYKPQNDLFRVKLPRQSVPKEFKKLVFKFEPSEKGADLFLIWDYSAIRIPFIFKP
jgi:hypothetical protein